MGFSKNWRLDGGTITTDGTIGYLTEANILDWSINYHSNERSFTLTPANSTHRLQFESSRGLLGTASQLLMDSADGSNTSRENFRFLDPTLTLQYGVDFQSSNESFPGRMFLLDAETNPTFFALTHPTNEPYLIGVAAVPEPSGSFLIVSLVFLFLPQRRRTA